MNSLSSNAMGQILKITLKLIILLWLVVSIASFASSPTDNSENLRADFNEMVSLSKEMLNELSLEVETYKQWYETYKMEPQLINKGVSGNSVSQQFDEIKEEIERLEHLAKGEWLGTLSNQLDIYITAKISAEEISNWIHYYKEYVEKIQSDSVALGRKIEKIKQAYPIGIPSQTTITLPPLLKENSAKVILSVADTVPVEVMEFNYNPAGAEEQVILEASLLYLLEGLEIWGEWLNPTNEIGLLPEAEGRFMLPSTPIFQAGGALIPGGIGVVGFAQPIIISYDGIPQGFTEEISESLPIDYDDSIEDVFQKVSYYDRLVYQYGVQISGRTVQTYRKPIETKLTLSNALQEMGASPDMAEVWVEEYAEIAYLPQIIQLSWLIAGNPLAKNYKLHTESLLEAFDLNAFVTPSNQGEFTLPQTTSPEWINEDPFWRELQNQPFLKAFADLLSGTSEEVQRSFIVSLFFVEPSLPIIQAKSTSNVRKGIRSKPFFWDDGEASSNKNTTPAITATIDPEQGSLVAEALQQRTNLIHYWTPLQGDILIPWSSRDLLNPNGDIPYFIIAITALPQFVPITLQRKKSSHALIVKDIVSNYLPKNQPVFKIFLGTNPRDRKILNAKGAQVAFSTNFVWNTQTPEPNTLMQYATEYFKSRKFPYAAIKLDNGPYLAGSLSQLKELLQNEQNYTLEAIILGSKGLNNYKGRNLSKRNITQLRSNETWLQYATRVSTEAFSWLPQSQKQLLVKSTHRAVTFKRNLDLTPEISASSMVQWSTLPSNEGLLAGRSQWQSNIFLIQVKDGYFFIISDELNHLQKYSDETPKVHSLLLAAREELNITFPLRSILQSTNLDCDSLRVLSAGGLDLAYNPQCLIIISDSGRELAQADTQTLLTRAQRDNQPIVIFRPKDKPASALPLRRLVDANSDDIESLTVATLVPVYDLEGLESTLEEKEESIEIGITDSIRRTLQFFPKQNTFEILLPEKKRSKS